MDTIVGKWFSGPTGIFGLTEYLDAVGHPEIADQFNREFVLEVKREGDKLVFDALSEGYPWMKTVIHVGTTTTDNVPGVGSVDVETGVEGNKIYSKTNYKGKPLVKYIYVENDIFYIDCFYDNVKMTLVNPKA